MLNFQLDYASPSAFQAERARALLGFTAESGRKVRFKGKVKSESVFLVRTVLRALGEVVWSQDNWLGDQFYDILDPIITVHPDRLFFEVFSQDQSVHAMASFHMDIFQTEGETQYGTANVDFTSWLWGALGEMRSSRSTWFQVDNAGLEVSTLGAGGRFEKNVEVPFSWVRGFLELQAAATLPGTRIKVRPVDLLGIIRFLRFSKARTSPRGMRYEFEPDQPVRVVLEPWEEAFILKDSEHHYSEPKITRLWGRRRLRLLEPMLPFTNSAEIILKGRSLPSFYMLDLSGIEFNLSCTGWTGQSFSQSDGFHLSNSTVELSDTTVSEGLKFLEEKRMVTREELEKHLSTTPQEAEAILAEICRKGRAFYQPFHGTYRHRVLFVQEPDFAEIFPPNPRLEQAEQLVAQGKVEVTACEPRETTKVRKLGSPQGKVKREITYRDWHYQGKVDTYDCLELVVSDLDKIIFGKCGCKHFQDNLLSQGPCEHMLALRLVAQEQRIELPTSTEFKEER